MRPHPTTRPGYRPPIERQCRYCGETFYANPADVRRGRAVYCSTAHRDAGADRKGPKRPHSARITCRCETCGKPFQTTENANAKWPRRFCDWDCYRNRPKSDVDRFWKYVERGEPDECWWWIGGRHHSSSNNVEYGSLAWPTGTSRMIQAHRVSWEIHFGAIPEGMLVCHKCDHPLCVNPAHLFLGTHADNTHDMLAKGRHRAGPPCGERNANAKLNADIVREIRARYQPGKIRMRDLAAEYGVNASTIRMVVNRRCWDHVE